MANEQGSAVQKLSKPVQTRPIPVFEGSALTILWAADLKRDLLPFIPGRSFIPSEPESLERTIERLHTLADEDNLRPCKCYFIGGAEGCIKIGMSTDPKARLSQLQMGSPVRLSILAIAPGGGSRERAYHVQFGGHWSHGEWFNRAPEIEAEIERLNTGPETLVAQCPGPTSSDERIA